MICSFAPPTSLYVMSGFSSTVIMVTEGSILGGKGSWIWYFLLASTPTRMPSSMSVGDTFLPRPTTYLAIWGAGKKKAHYKPNTKNDPKKRRGAQNLPPHALSISFILFSSLAPPHLLHVDKVFGILGAGIDNLCAAGHLRRKEQKFVY
jgi:hypothetical protein